MVSVCNNETHTKDTWNKYDNKELYHKCESSVYRQIFYLFGICCERIFGPNLVYDTHEITTHSNETHMKCVIIIKLDESVTHMSLPSCMLVLFCLVTFIHNIFCQIQFINNNNKRTVSIESTSLSFLVIFSALAFANSFTYNTLLHLMHSWQIRALR